MDRKTAILRSANEHFAVHGFRGASLRDIARDAQVSLTLLNHHFGSKLDLLRAVVHAHRYVLAGVIDAGRSALPTDGSRPRIEALVSGLIDVIRRAGEDDDGRRFMLLLSRMTDDSQADAMALVRQEVEEAADAFIEVVMAAYPNATREKAALGYLCTTTSILRCATSGSRLAEMARRPSERRPVPAPASSASLPVAPAGAMLDPGMPARVDGAAVSAVAVAADAAEAASSLAPRGESSDAGVSALAPAPDAAPRPSGPATDHVGLQRFLVAGLDALMA